MTTIEKEGYIIDLPNDLGFDFKIGVVISYDKRRDQGHCGIAFELDGEYHVIHLASHNLLLHGKNLDDFRCIIKPNLHPHIQESMASMCQVLKDDIDNGYSAIPYGFLYDNYALIKADGSLHLTEKEIGLTCATYVITLFHTYGIDLVDLSNWPPRVEDLPWFERIINYFKWLVSKKEIDEDHVHRMETQKGSPRFRPEEVAVSTALYDGHYADTPIIWQKGAKLKSYLVSISQ